MASGPLCGHRIHQLTSPLRSARHNVLRPAVRYSSSTTGSEPPNPFAHLTRDLPLRKFPILYHNVTPVNSYSLSASLSSFLPPSWVSTPPHIYVPIPMQPGHHLVYFNPILPLDKLLADGTDPLQSPGPPFVRRMWAGGKVRFRTPKDGYHSTFKLNGRLVCMAERIRDVQIKGPPGEEKVFVGIERRMGRPVLEEYQMLTKGEVDGARVDRVDEIIRQRMLVEDEDRFGQAILIERRNIVFMRERTPEELRKIASPKQLAAPNKPDTTHTLTPTPALLFRYSALSFNAHAIHLDPDYCRAVEGHRGLLVHGPLSLTLLLTQLQAHLGTLNAASSKTPPASPAAGETFSVISEIEYRNLAPLYCGEPMTLCLRDAGGDVGPGSRKYECWIENEEGGMCVRATARTVQVDKREVEKHENRIQDRRSQKPFTRG